MAGWLLLFTNVFFKLPLKAQEADSTQAIEVLYAELDAIFADESDSTLALFKLVDSLLLADEVKYHSLIFRAAYLGQVAAAGRAQDFSQNGYSTGISYFHSSDFFVDISSFWNSGYKPAYYLTALGVGYNKNYAKNWSTSISHDFYFYNDTLQAPFNKAIQLGQYFDYKFLNAGIDYSFLYGNTSAHRLMLNVSFEKKWDFNGLLKRLSIHPGVGLTAGNADIVYVRQSETPVYDLIDIIRQDAYPALNDRELLALGNFIYNDRNGAALIFLRRKGFSNQQIAEVLTTYEAQQIQEENAFGIMNYSFNMPVLMQFGKVNVMLNYTYNLPVALPNEPFEYEPNGFLSVSLSYMLFWK